MNKFDEFDKNIIQLHCNVCNSLSNTISFPHLYQCNCSNKNKKCSYSLDQKIYVILNYFGKNIELNIVNYYNNTSSIYKYDANSCIECYLFEIQNDILFDKIKTKSLFKYIDKLISIS